MIYFSQTLVNKIKSAADDKEVENVINGSMQRLKTKNVNGHVIHRFIMKMGLTLHQEKGEQVSAKVLQNMDSAIHLFKKLQSPLNQNA